MVSPDLPPKLGNIHKYHAKLIVISYSFYSFFHLTVQWSSCSFFCLHPQWVPAAFFCRLYFKVSSFPSSVEGSMLEVLMLPKLCSESLPSFGQKWDTVVVVSLYSSRQRVVNSIPNHKQHLFELETGMGNFVNI